MSHSARPGTIVLSEDGASWAYVEAVAGGQRMVVDGVAGPTFAGCDRPSFAPKTRRVFYFMKVARGGREPYGMVADGARVAPTFAQPGTFVFSSDGRHWAAIGGLADQGPTVLIADGKEVGRWKDATWPSFSPDGAHLAALVRRDDDAVALVVDGKETRVFPAPTCRVSPTFRWSPVGPNLTPQFSVDYLSDGSLVVITQDADGWALYHDGERLGSYVHNVWTGAAPVDWAADYHRDTSIVPRSFRTADAAPAFAWWERAGGEFDRWRVLRNGVPLRDDFCDRFWDMQPLVLSRDGKRVAYFCGKLGPGTIGQGDVVDGEHSYGPFFDAYGLVHSDDGAHLGYGGFTGERKLGWTLYRDGEPVAGPFDGVWRPRFDPTGVHLAWEAEREHRNLLGIDRRALASFDEVLMGPAFDVPGYASWVIRRRQSLRRLDARIPEARASSAKARAAAAPAS